MFIDPECEAASLLSAVPSSPVPGARRLVAAHLGEGRVFRSRFLEGRDGEIVRRDDGWAIRVKPGLPGEAERWALMHELAEWRLKKLRYWEPDAEFWAERITSALVLPRVPFLRDLNRLGRSWDALAKRYTTTTLRVLARFQELKDAVVYVDGCPVDDVAYPRPGPGMIKTRLRSARDAQVALFPELIEVYTVGGEEPERRRRKS